jgi:hypothetical protein
MGLDVGVAYGAAHNATEHNFLQAALVVASVACTAYEGYQVYQTYEREGGEAAMRHLGISVVEGAVVAGVAGVAFKVGKAVYPSLKEAFKAAVANNTVLKASLSGLETKLGTVEQAIRQKFSSGGIEAFNPATKVDVAAAKAAQQKSVRFAEGEAVSAEHRLPEIDAPWKSRYWDETSEYTFKGQTNKVYKRDDLIDLKLVDPKKGRTNLQLMQEGKAPLGPDGNPINLHHSLQTMDSPLVEITQNMHQQYGKIIHINPSSIPSAIDRVAFKKWKSDYWVQRAKELGGKQ